MKFRASRDQLAQIIANAYNASNPAGLGFMNAVDGDRNAEAFYYDADHALKSGKLFLDYVSGRMVKIYLQMQDGFWIVPDELPKTDYQSWSTKYRTYKALIESVVKVEE